ncbi:TPA: GntR family transcriptional regulator [Streptococcus suis]|nr:GntR family transcriptional regulator [Streptococcus suis]
MKLVKQGNSRYQQVAVALAKQIMNGKYSVGEKLKARSTVASNFNVSPETARKAINLLVDLDIVEVRHGSGVTVLSKENAQNFLKTFETAHSLQEQKLELKEHIARQKQELDQIEKMVEQIVAQTRSINNTYPFEPFQLLLDKDSDLFGCQLKELNLWQTTGATLIAIERNGEIVLSPGPYAVLEKGDTIYFVGSEQTYSRVNNLFQ